MQGSTTAQPQDDDQSKRVIEDVEAGESDDVIGSWVSQKPPLWEELIIVDSLEKAMVGTTLERLDG